MRPYSRLALLAALAAGARADPESLTRRLQPGHPFPPDGGSPPPRPPPRGPRPPRGSRVDPESLTVHGQTVRPAEHLLANPGELTLIVTTSTAKGAVAAQSAGRKIASASGDSIHIVNVGFDQADAVMTRLEGTSGVVRVELDQPVGLLPDEDDDRQQLRRRLAEETPYGIGMVLEDVEWWQNKFATPPEGSSKICVVDTGYDNGHEDLPLLGDDDGFSPYPGQLWNVDGQGHGTHCAGTIGAKGNNVGVVGVIPGSLGDKFSFYIGKGLQNSGGGTYAGIIDCIEKCVENGSNVISMSLGGSGSSTAFQEALDTNYKDKDVLIIAAAGNGGNSNHVYPASYPSAMSVAAVASNGQRAGFSTFNDQTEIAGPGVSVKSTYNNGAYRNLSGTSMATPHVAGVAGLLRMYFPDCKAFQIRRAMISSAEDKGATGCDNRYGHGIVNAKQAFEFLVAHPCDPNEAFQEAQGGCNEPAGTTPPVPAPTPSPTNLPPTAPSPTAPTAPSPTAPTAPSPTGVIKVDLFQMQFTFTPADACVEAQPDGAAGGTPRQCAQACAVLENCAGVVATLDGECFLVDSAPLCVGGAEPNVVYYEREATMYFDN